MAYGNMHIPESVCAVLCALEAAGISAYPVGGCVRDFVLGETPHDFDIAAEADPAELCRAAKDFHTVDAGLDFGTLKIISDGDEVEVTCCRSDGQYSDRRRPDSVLYTKDILSDLARRDFTVNAMAFSEKKGVIDPFGGAEDAKKRIIRAVGCPEERFREDALRIMRALRFASVLDFEIEEKTALAIHELCPLLDEIAAERIFTELKKLLCGKNVFKVLMEYWDVICRIIPEMRPCVGFDQKSSYHIYDVYEHIAKSVELCPPDGTLRLAMLFHDIGKPYSFTEEDCGRVRHFKGHPKKSAEIAETVLCRLKADKATVRRVAFLIKYHDERPAPEKKVLHRYLLNVGFDGARELFKIRRADIAAHSQKALSELENIESEEKIVSELERENACIKTADLEIDGSRIIELGAEKGPAVGEILEHLLNCVANGEIENRKSDLERAAEKEISRHRH